MKKIEFLRALGDIDDKYYLEAAPEESAAKQTVGHFGILRFAPIAAAVAMIAVLAYQFFLGAPFGAPPISPETSQKPGEPTVSVDIQIQQSPTFPPLERDAEGHYLIPGQNVTPITFANPMEFNILTGEPADLKREMYSIDLSEYYGEYAAVNVLRVSGGGHVYLYQPGELSYSLRNPEAELPSRYIFEYGGDLFRFDAITEELQKITHDTVGEYSKADFLSVGGMDTFGARWAEYPVPDDSGRYIAFSSNRRDYMRWYNNQNENFAANDIWMLAINRNEEYLLLENAEPQCWIDDILIYRNTADGYSICSYNMATGEKKTLLDGYTLPSRISKDTFIAETVITEDGTILEIRYQIIDMATGKRVEFDTTLEDYYLWRDPVFSLFDDAMYQTYRYQPDRQTRPDIDKFVIVKIGTDNQKTVYELPDSLEWEWGVSVSAILGDNRLLLSIDDDKYAIVSLVREREMP